MQFEIRDGRDFREIWNTPIDNAKAYLLHVGDLFEDSPCVRNLYSSLTVGYHNQFPVVRPGDFGRALGVSNFPSFTETYECQPAYDLCQATIRVLTVSCSELPKIEEGFKQYIRSFDNSLTNIGPSIGTGLFIAFAVCCVGFTLSSIYQKRRVASAADLELTTPINQTPAPPAENI